ncbi:hypothetical protein CRUP_024741 [Coryphaenoides rupestris]|nr:hypothetical protein CRUP_024741 [Coryphaenoides rupestris]
MTRRGVKNKRSDRRAKADATDDKAPDACLATSGAEPQTSDRRFESAASLFSRDDRPLDSAASLFSRDDGQAENEEISNMMNIKEPPPVSNIVAQRYEGETHNEKMHGEGLAHFQGGHVYKGAFSEGLMHGYGLYTWSDGVKYEGEFVANVPAGRGTYAWPDGSSYEGDVHNAIRHGIGTHRCADTPVWYRGQWHRGKRQGKGVMYYNQDQTSWYDGDWLDNKREGWGVRRYGHQRPGRNTHVGVTMKEKAGQSDQGYPSGNFYEGEWRDNARHGQGTLRWVTLGQQHAGTWRNGVQVGIKERFPSKPADENHHEVLKTLPPEEPVPGGVCSGARHGPGSFRYASGERYQGDWKNNEKHGQGKFTFTNGRSIEREFVDDHMVEVPQAGSGRSDQPQSSPPHPPWLPGQGEASMLGPYTELDLHFLLERLPEGRRSSELRQVEFMVLRHVTELRSIYSFYSSLGHASCSPDHDHAFLLSRLQYWRLLKDCRLHLHPGSCLARLDRLVPADAPSEEILSPYTGILLPRLISSLVSIAYHTYQQVLGPQRNILAECFSRLMQDDVLPNAKNVKGFLFGSVDRVAVALGYLEPCWAVYQALRQHSLAASGHRALTCRRLVFMFKDLNVFDSQLTPTKLLEVISAEDHDPSDPSDTSDSSGLSYCNLEQELTFLEFFEVLLGCADVQRDGAAEESPPGPDSPQPDPRGSPTGPDSPQPDPRGSRPGSDSPQPDGPHPEPSGSPAAAGPPPPDLLSQSDAAKGQPLSSTEDSSSTSPMEKSMEPLNSSSVEKSGVGVKEAVRPSDEASADRQLDVWIQRTHLFFSQTFFPSYEHGRRLDREVEDARRRWAAQRRIALAKAQQRARQREEELKAEEEEEDEKRRKEEEEESRVDKSGVEDEADGPSPPGAPQGP